MRRLAVRVAIVAGVVIAWLAAPVLGRARRSWASRVAVSGQSMVPTLRPGDWVLVDSASYADARPAAGDVVVVPDPREPLRWLIKRVASVDDTGSVRLTGDAPTASTDWRTFGPVASGGVLGRAWLRYWPPRRWGRVL